MLETERKGQTVNQQLYTFKVSDVAHNTNSAFNHVWQSLPSFDRLSGGRYMIASGHRYGEILQGSDDFTLACTPEDVDSITKLLNK